jgi:YggT family protein
VTAVLINFVQFLAFFLWLMLIARVILSWTNPMGGMGGGGGPTAFVYQMTEPILAPIRRVLPPTAGIDWSPLVAMLLIGVVLRVVTRL